MRIQKRTLSVFDMDSTIASFFLESCFFFAVPFDERLEYREKTMPWPHRLKRAMDRHHVKKAQVDKQLASIDLVEGMKEVFEHLHGQGSELIVLSGANDLLCWEYLRIKGCAAYFKKVIANKLVYDRHADRYHLELPEAKNCGLPLCGRAPCKKHELEAYLRHQKPYESVYFFGDGTNDLCGMSNIDDTGRVFIRKNHELHQSLQEEEGLLRHFKRKPEYWEDGRDLLTLLKA